MKKDPPLTSLEKKAWKIFESIGYEVKFHTEEFDPANTVYAQYRIPKHGARWPWIADFALPKAKIVIEIDGEYWHPSIMATCKMDDEERDRHLRRLGWKVVRLPERLVDEQHIQQLLHMLFDV